MVFISHHALDEQNFSLTFRYVIEGVVSYGGFNCNSTAFPMGYAKVSFHGANFGLWDPDLK